MCAGLIGWRCLKAAGEGARRLGLYGFGAAAQRPGDIEGQAFARSVGVAWAGGSDKLPAVPLDASVANLTRRDAREFLIVAQAHPPQVHTTTHPLARANDALADLRAGRVKGAAVLLP
jgi:propanol-preferring alcohol dehydrogenase